jgi:hypothetical protein
MDLDGLCFRPVSVHFHRATRLLFHHGPHCRELMHPS